MAVVAEASDGRECVRLAEDQSPDVVVMDIAMPNMNGIEATRRILAANPRIGVVILSMHQDESYVLRRPQGRRQGLSAQGLASRRRNRGHPRGRPGPLLPHAQDLRILQEDYIGALRQRGLEDSYDLLTDREREILQLIAEGRTNKEVASLLNISPTTVETHRTHILHKLDLHSVPELILYAVRKGIVT